MSAGGRRPPLGRRDARTEAREGTCADGGQSAPKRTLPCCADFTSVENTRKNELRAS